MSVRSLLAASVFAAIIAPGAASAYTLCVAPYDPALVTPVHIEFVDTGQTFTFEFQRGTTIGGCMPNVTATGIAKARADNSPTLHDCTSAGSPYPIPASAERVNLQIYFHTVQENRQNPHHVRGCTVSVQ